MKFFENGNTQVIALGGLGEVGKNMYVVAHDDEILIIDAGVMFPESDLMGVDYVIQDVNFLKENEKLLECAKKYAEEYGSECVIVSCGGGTPMRECNVREMRKNGRIVLLTAKPETILERVKNNHDRPLLEDNKNVSYIKELLEQRREKYEAAADLIIETDEKMKGILSLLEEDNLRINIKNMKVNFDASMKEDMLETNNNLI